MTFTVKCTSLGIGLPAILLVEHAGEFSIGATKAYPDAVENIWSGIGCSDAETAYENAVSKMMADEATGIERLRIINRSLPTKTRRNPTMLIPIKTQKELTATLPNNPNSETDSSAADGHETHPDEIPNVIGSRHAALTNEMVRYVNLKAALEVEDLDPQALLDTLEGETNLLEGLAEVAESVAQDECFADALTDRIRTIQERKSRLERSAETKRNLIIMAMEKAHLKCVKQPNATITVRATKPKLIVVDEALVPGKFFKSAEPILDRMALKAALEELPPDGEIPGVELSNGGVSLSIRVR